MNKRGNTGRREFLKVIGGIALGGVVFPASGAIRTLVPNDMLMNSTANLGGYEPPYVELHRSGALKERAEILWDMSTTTSARWAGAAGKAYPAWPA